MKIDRFHGTVIRIESRYIVLLLDSGEEKPILFSSLPEELHVGDRLCFRDDRWITEEEAAKKQRGRIRTLRSLLRGD